jgi:hypothetical protein
MPITLAKLRNITIAKTIDLGDGDKIELEYFPNKITPGYLDAVSKENDLMALAKTVAEFVASWDITDEDAPLPADVDGAAKLGIALLNTIITEVAQDVKNPNARKPARR